MKKLLIGERVAADWSGSRHLAVFTGALASDIHKVRYFDNTDGDVPDKKIVRSPRKQISNG
jgi:hypothetical protein